MENTNNNAVRKMKDFCCTLGKIQLESDYDIKLNLFRDGKCEDPSCTHTIKGSSKCRIIKLMAGLGAAAVIISIFCALCACMKD